VRSRQRCLTLPMERHGSGVKESGVEIVSFHYIA
jgi:hypothetical protein